MIKGGGETVAITSKGYEGSINYLDWAGITAHMGGTYSVFGDAGSFAASAGPGDRQVVIAPGSAAGAGILDVSDAPITVAGGAVGSGSRWDMIVLRREWGVVKETTIEIKAGASTKALPSRAATPGALDEQPMFLVRFTAGQTAVQEIVDLRVWRGDAGLFANDVLVRSYMNRIGTSIRVGAEQWTRVLAGTTPTWVDLATWAQVTGRPSTYPPSAHNHAELNIPSTGVRWVVEAGTGKAYLRDDTNNTWPWTILRDGSLVTGKIPVDRIVGVLPLSKGGLGATTAPTARAALNLGAVATENVLPMSKGGHGATTAAGARTALGLGSVATENVVPFTKGGHGAGTREGALANLGVWTVETADFDLPNNTRGAFLWTVPVGSAIDYSVIPTTTDARLEVFIGRTGNVIKLTVENLSGASRTSKLLAQIVRKGAASVLVPDPAGIQPV